MRGGTIHHPTKGCWAGKLRCFRFQSWALVLGVEMLPLGNGSSLSFEHRGARSLPASLIPVLFLGSCPSWVLGLPWAACSSQGLSKGHCCGSALSKRLLLRAAARSKFPGHADYVLLDESCAERSIRAMPATDCQQSSVLPHLPCSKRSPRESRLGIILMGSRLSAPQVRETTSELLKPHHKNQICLIFTH